MKTSTEELVARNRCRHCVCLVEVEGKWTCDESGKPIKDTIQCPEGLELRSKPECRG